MGSKNFSRWLLIWGRHAHLQNGSGQKLGRWKWGGTSWMKKMSLWWMLIFLQRPTLVTRERESQHWKKCPPRAPNPLLRLSPQRRRIPRKALLRRQRAVPEALNKGVSGGSDAPSPFPVLDPNLIILMKSRKSPFPSQKSFRIPKQRVQGEVRNAGSWICWTHRSRSLRIRSRSPGPMVLSMSVAQRNVWNHICFFSRPKYFSNYKDLINVGIDLKLWTTSYRIPLSLGKVGPYWFRSIFILCTRWGLKGVVNTGM